jgi:hypothetical protein
MEKSTPKETKVQQDRFWTWRVNREENLIIKEFEDIEERSSNQERLQKSIIKAKIVAENLKHRATSMNP